MHAFGPLFKRIITRIEVRHAADVATLKGVHAEVEILNFITSMNHVLMILYGAISVSVLNPETWPAIPKLIDSAKIIAKIQDATVKSTPFVVGGVILFESRNWDGVLTVPNHITKINVERGAELFGIPGLLFLEDDYEEDLKVGTFGFKTYIEKKRNLRGRKSNDFKFYHANAKGEPEGENLFETTWRTKPLQ